MTITSGQKKKGNPRGSKVRVQLRFKARSNEEPEERLGTELKRLCRNVAIENKVWGPGRGQDYREKSHKRKKHTAGDSQTPQD